MLDAAFLAGMEVPLDDVPEVGIQIRAARATMAWLREAVSDDDGDQGPVVYLEVPDG